MGSLLFLRIPNCILKIFPLKNLPNYCLKSVHVSLQNCTMVYTMNASAWCSRTLTPSKYFSVIHSQKIVVSSSVSPTSTVNPVLFPHNLQTT